MMPLLRFGYGLNIRRRRIESLSIVSRFQDETSTSFFLTGLVDFASTCLSVTSEVPMVRQGEFVSCPHNRLNFQWKMEAKVTFAY